MIENAVDDYQMLSRLGVIVDGEVKKIKDRRAVHGVRNYKTETEVLQLVDFFRGNRCQRWLELANFKTMSAAAIRTKLGL